MNGLESLPAGARFHEPLAASWAEGYKHTPSFRRREAFVHRILAGQVGFGSQWLDVGCGSGVFTRALAQRGARVTGIDGAPAMIQAAKSFPDSTGPTPDYHLVSTVELLPFASASFDGILCLSVLEYLDDPEATARELRRVLKPGGVALLSVPYRWSAVRNAQRAARAVVRLFGRDPYAYLAVSRFAASQQGFTNMLSRSGFVVLALDGFRGLAPTVAASLMPADLLFGLVRTSSENPD